MGCGASRPSNATPEQVVTAVATVTIRALDVQKSSSSQAGSVLVKTWTGENGIVPFPELDDPEFAIPALITDKAPLAICISGGGFRAASLSIGWLRGLYAMGVLQRARYLATCSGSSWVASALCFQQAASVAEFLGPHLPPEECTLEALKQVGEKGRSCAAAVADAAPVHDYVRDLVATVVNEVEGSRRARAWTAAMTAAFLKPFGLDDVDHSTTTCSGTKGQVHETVAARAATAGRGTVYCASVQELPYPIIGQSLMLPKERELFYPFEWTPLYGGCPVTFPKTTPKLGSGYVEALGLNCELLEKPAPASTKSAAEQEASASVLVRPTGPASLGEAIGISSSGISCWWAFGKTAETLELHKLLGFHTASYFDHQEWGSGTVQSTDGGGVDNYAVYPALRRKVPRLMVLSASPTPIESFDQFAQHMKDLAAMFGSWPGTDGGRSIEEANRLPAAELNAQRQVFPAAAFAELHAGLLARLQAGGPPVHLAEYEVLENRGLGISGGWRVKVLWVVNDVQPRWEAALPADTREKLESDRNGLAANVDEKLHPLDAVTFRTFPHVPTLAMNYPPELVGLMAAHASYMVMEARGLIEEGLLGDA